MEIRKVPIYNSLTRPNLLYGCESSLFFTSVLISLAVVFHSMSISVSLIAISVFIASIVFFRKMARIDPFLTKIYLKHCKQNSFYSSYHSPWRIKND